MSDGGKGSAPRKTQDQDAYSKGWDAIFGSKKVSTIMDKTPQNVQDDGQFSDKEKTDGS